MTRSELWAEIQKRDPILAMVLQKAHWKTKPNIEKLVWLPERQTVIPEVKRV